MRGIGSIDELHSFYSGRRVMVTGHTGFKGGWLSLWLKSMGAEVMGYSLEPPTEPSVYDVIGLKHSLDLEVIDDIRNYGSLAKMIMLFRPEVIFHLAAQPIVNGGYRDPKGTYETNILGTLNILESIREAGLACAILLVTTDKVYRDEGSIYGYRETDRLGGYDPYSAGKACAELIADSYYSSFFRDRGGIGLATLRAGNVIGGGDWADDRLVPDCVRALSRDQRILIRNPDSIRPWQYVLEPLSGYLGLGMRLCGDPVEYSGAWNFGPGRSSEITVRELVEDIISFWGGGAYSVGTSQGMLHAHESSCLRLDNTKAGVILGWNPVYSVTEAVKRSVGWYKSFYGGMGSEDMKRISLDEIEEYETNMGVKCLCRE